jgi:ribokinase
MKNVFIVGSINADIVAFADSLPKAGETLLGSSFDMLPGGKGANQATGASKCGANTKMIGAVGSDSNGQFMLQALQRNGVGIEMVSAVSQPTGVALIMVGGGENQIMVVPGANNAIPMETIGHMPIQVGDVLLTQMETTIAANRAAMERAKEAGAVVIFNPAPASMEAKSVLPLVDFLVVNEHEAALLAEMPVAVERLAEDIEQISQRIGLNDNQTLIVTIGAHGAVAYNQGAFIVVPGLSVDAVDSTGAGDCFCGYLAAALAEGTSLEDAMKLANRAAAISVQRKGAAQSIPNREEVHQ